MRWLIPLIAGLALGAPGLAQDQRRDEAAFQGNGRSTVQPYIEVAQVLSAQISPGDDVLTFTQIAAGIDANTQGRNSGASVSLRYERNIAWGGDNVDTDTLSGIARGTLAVIPRNVSLEAGGLASRTRFDGGGAVSSNPLVREDAESRIYSIYAGPTLAARVGDVAVNGFARVGYNRFENANAAIGPAGSAIDLFDDSMTYNGRVTASTRSGAPLPVGLAVTGGIFQENISNLDQRVRDAFARVDVTIPVALSLAVVGGVGYENVEISSRDALRDANGELVLDAGGRLVTDEASPRRIAYDVDGLLWDVGVLWRPSSRTSLEARVGRRYDSTTYYGNFTYRPSPRSALGVVVYDQISGFGGVLGNALAGLSSDFSALRNPVTGDFGGLVTGGDGPGVIGALGSVRSAAFRGRGVRASYQHRIGRLEAAIGAGYDRRTFIAAADTPLAAADGLTDESWYVTAALSRRLGRNAILSANAYANWFDAAAGGGDATGYGASASYNRLLTERLSARAAIALDVFDSEFSPRDLAFATALLGLRYDF